MKRTARGRVARVYVPERQKASFLVAGMITATIINAWFSYGQA
jgi:hypothetical protein